jgi:hypothetical protein
MKLHMHITVTCMYIQGRIYQMVRCCPMVQKVLGTGEIHGLVCDPN